MIVKDWNSYYSKITEKRRDLYFTENYCRLYNTVDRKANAFIYEEKDQVFLFPIMLGEINKTGLYDFETPYGYGGPVSNSTDPDFLKNACSALKHEFCEAGIIAGFIRFHPVLGNASLLSSHFPVFFDRKTIAVDLSPDIDSIWTKQIYSKNRNVIRKAEKAGLVYQAEPDLSSYEEFKDLYAGTMDKLNADSFYYFEESYFENFKTEFSENSFLATVRLDGKLISSAIVMYDSLYGHYHLAGSDRNYLKLNPNNFLLWETIKILKEKNLRSFHLGGGTSSSDEDKLLIFKKRFSGNEKLFYIGKMILDEKKYTSFCQEWMDTNPGKVSSYGNRTLKYRY